jgi:acyl-coenzyme A thioesterase PaaI-like protein
MYGNPIERGVAQVLRGRIAHDDEIGVRYGVAEDGRTVLELPFSPILVEAGAGHIGTGPLVTVLDSACGIGAMLALEFREGTATVDLRVDYLRDLSPGASCLVVAMPADVDGQPEAGMVTMRAEARETGTECAVAHAVGRFIRRRLPAGGAAADVPPAPPLATAADYGALMGFVPEDTGLRMPFRAGLVGNGSLPSLHGGAVAAHMQAAASAALAARRARPARLITAHFSFLRFTGAADTLASATVELLGASVASVRVTSRQDAGRVTAQGQFTFVWA